MKREFCWQVCDGPSALHYRLPSLRMQVGGQGIYALPRFANCGQDSEGPRGQELSEGADAAALVMSN
jgi:hypothetical protein